MDGLLPNTIAVSKGETDTEDHSWDDTRWPATEDHSWNDKGTLYTCCGLPIFIYVKLIAGSLQTRLLQGAVSSHEQPDNGSQQVALFFFTQCTKDEHSKIGSRPRLNFVKMNNTTLIQKKQTLVSYLC